MSNIVYEYLSDKEKNDIIISRIKSHEYTVYGAEITKLEILSINPVDSVALAAAEQQISDVQSKIALLKSEQDSLSL